MKLPDKPAKRRNETAEITHPAIAALNAMPGVRVFRNNNGALEDRRGVKVRYGLGVGSSDIVGMVNCCLKAPPSFAVFFALECKWPGEKPTKDQLRWGHTVVSCGGFWCVIHSVEEAVDAVRICRELQPK